MKIYVIGNSKNQFLPSNNIRERFYVDQPHEGDNIDYLNPWFCELTGLYYIWKHATDNIIGLEHYRRCFLSNNSNQLLNETEINDLLQKHDILAAKAEYSKIRPAKTWLIQNGKMNEVEKFVAFSKVYVGDDYYNKCWDILNGEYHCLGNMFICKKELIDEYCKFIFDVFEKYILAESKCKRKIPPRIIGYFAEFLFAAWLELHDKKIGWQKYLVNKSLR